MTRFEEVTNDILYMDSLLESASKVGVTKDIITNITLSCINLSLNDISVTLAKMYDLMGNEKNDK